ncbi:MAG: ABC transporter ATP-binding protein [Candidatus Hodarchaeales archaeon]|jgi:ABC-type Fe3+/spermidine/putrescine transport system ATPase subunit
MPTIEVKNVTKRFGRIIALKDVNLTINEGDYNVILGPSGCGKTTLLNVISGILKPTEGQVLIDGEDVTDLPVEERKLSFVFQNIALFPHMTVSENAGYSPFVRGKDTEDQKNITTKALELVDLLELRDELPRKLPHGMQQKVALARAIATEAKLMILDEPISALDPEVRAKLRFSIRRLVKELGLTAIHVTHDQNIAMAVADKIILMKSGKIVQFTSPQQMYGHPVSLFEAFFIGQGNFLEGYAYQQTEKALTIRLRREKDIKIKKRDNGNHKIEFESGEPVVVFARPENTIISEKKLSNTIRGNILRRVFMGGFYRYFVFTLTEDNIIVDAPLTKAVLNKDDIVYIKFKQNSTIVFPAPQYGLMEELRLE